MTLTLRIFISEVTNETYVLLHPVKSSKLQSIPYDFHRFLQQLETGREQREEDRKAWLTVIRGSSRESALKQVYLHPARTPPEC